jgi:hypothetical protein
MQPTCLCPFAERNIVLLEPAYAAQIYPLYNVG